MIKQKLELNMIHNFDALSGLKMLDDESVDCIITSPPYYKLRDYHHDNQLGQESTVHEYIDKLVEIFMECHRVLKSDGTLWVNISDTYNGNKKGKTDKKYNYQMKEQSNLNKKKQSTIRYKSLLGVPSRFEIAMIDSGWVLRNEIIWHKPNAMPSSAIDRFTIDYEKVFLFTKEPSYTFKQLKEPMKTTDTNPPRGSKGVLGGVNSGLRKQDKLDKGTYTGFNNRYEPPQDLMRNMRSVWSINTEASNIEHFAMYPKELVERCIDAGCKLGGVVLDPFMGSGTTGIVAKMKNRDYIGFEINKDYCAEANARVNNQVRLLDIFNI